jgi:3-dehydroquinate dehydratase-2
MTARFLLLQGANMEFMGIRQPEIYGRTTAAELDAMAEAHARARGFALEIFYTNHEGAAIDRLFAAHRAGIDGCVMNPGGLCYAGYALRDAIRGLNFPVLEVHMTNHYDRGIRSVTAAACKGVFMGTGIQTYMRAFDALAELHAERSA